MFKDCISFFQNPQRLPKRSPQRSPLHIYLKKQLRDHLRDFLRNSHIDLLRTVQTLLSRISLRSPIEQSLDTSFDRANKKQRNLSNTQFGAQTSTEYSNKTWAWAQKHNKYNNATQVSTQKSNEAKGIQGNAAASPSTTRV